MTDLEFALSNMIKAPLEIESVCTVRQRKAGCAPSVKFEIDCVQQEEKEPIPDDEIPFCDLNCSECDVCQEECFDCELELEEEDPMMWGIPDVDRIIFNPPATIVFWDDGTKTVVKCMEDQPYEKYAGFAMACMKKMFGSTSRAKAIMNECDTDNLKPVVEPKKTEQKPKEYDSNPQLTKFICDAINDLAKALTGEASKEKKDETPTE